MLIKFKKRKHGYLHYNFKMVLTWSLDTDALFLKTVHTTASEQGGVVKEPW